MSPFELRPVRRATVRKYAAIQSVATRRLRKLAATATAEELLEAGDWYAEAELEIEAHAYELGVPAEVLADVVALTSPRCQWEFNLPAAVEILEAFLEGDRVYPHAPLPTCTEWAYEWLMATGTRGWGPKTRSFAENLKGNYAEVTVDVWATRAAIGRDEPRGALEYAAIARAYRTVAAELNLEPAVFQALAWIIIRNRKGDQS